MGLLLCAIRHQSWDSKARNNLSLSEMQWWIRVFQITNKSKNSSCEVVMVASQNILCFLPTEKRPWEDQTELESGVLSLQKQNKVVRLKDNYDTKHYVSIDFIFQHTFCCCWSRRRNFPSSSSVSPTGKCSNIKAPLISPKLLGYQHPPSPHMQWLFVHHFHSINLYCDFL